MLARIGIQPPEDIRSCIFLELDGGDETQKFIPVLSDQSIVDGLVWLDFRVFVCLVFGLKNINRLFSNTFDAWAKEKSNK